MIFRLSVIDSVHIIHVVWKIQCILAIPQLISFSYGKNNILNLVRFGKDVYPDIDLKALGEGVLFNFSPKKIKMPTVNRLNDEGLILQ